MRHLPPPASVPRYLTTLLQGTWGKTQDKAASCSWLCQHAPSFPVSLLALLSAHPDSHPVGQGKSFVCCPSLPVVDCHLIVLLKEGHLSLERSAAISPCVTPSNLLCLHSPLSLFTRFPCLAVLYHPCTFSPSSSDRVGVRDGESVYLATIQAL